MTDQTENFIASTEDRLVECLGLARALLAMKVLVAQIVQHAQRAILGTLLGASVTV